MTELFKCLALFCAVSAAYGFTDVRGDVTWFKNDEKIRNKFVTGVVNGILDADCSVNVNGEEVRGECMPKLECSKLGGEPGGLCSLMGSCCVVRKTCSETTAQKTSYFVPPKNFQTPCILVVKKYSSDVCQIRLDFEKFVLAQPTAEDQIGHFCTNEQFLIESARKKPGFSKLCGRNTGQHIYIHMDKDQTQIKLRFNLKPETDDHPEVAEWKIKITQLECRQSRYDSFLNAPSKLMAIHNNLNNLKNKAHSKCYNCDLIAPPGCLQYYTNDSGTFESFNYNGGNGPYIGGLDYGVCFKQTADVYGAEYTLVKFLMSDNNERPETNNYKECHPEEQAIANMSQDYIRIPEGILNTKYVDCYCGNVTGKITAKPHEPLYVGVHTDKFVKSDEQVKPNKEKGFKIRYQLLKNEWDLTEK